MEVSYKCYQGNTENNPALLLSNIDEAACFSALKSHKDRENIFVDFKVFKKRTSFTEKQIAEYNGLCNKWLNTKVTLTVEEDCYIFRAFKNKTYLSILCPLVLRRYLQEESQILRYFFDLKEKYKKPNKNKLFSLFCVSHYAVEINNSNHTFLYSGSYGRIYDLITPKQWEEKINDPEFQRKVYIGMSESIRGELSFSKLNKTVKEYFPERVDELIKKLTT